MRAYAMWDDIGAPDEKPKSKLPPKKNLPEPKRALPPRKTSDSSADLWKDLKSPSQEAKSALPSLPPRKQAPKPPEKSKRGRKPKLKPPGTGKKNQKRDLHQGDAYSYFDSPGPQAPLSGELVDWIESTSEKYKIWPLKSEVIAFIRENGSAMNERYRAVFELYKNYTGGKTSKWGGPNETVEALVGKYFDEALGTTAWRKLNRPKKYQK